MPDTPPPSGFVCFLFTDIEGSTRLWERFPEAMRLALARHDAILRAAIQTQGGHVFKTVGDAFCAVFAEAPAALSAAIEIQRRLRAEPWPAEIGAIRVRAGLHAGEAEEREGDYFGPPLNRVARLMSAAHGEQVLLSRAVNSRVQEALPEGCILRDLGSHRLKDLLQPERLWQLVHPDLPAEFPPIRSLQAYANNLPAQLTSFVGREEEMAEILGLLPGARLLTLVGSGGCGKTRLALQAAAEVVERFGDGVWLVELAELADGALAAGQVAAVLGLREQSGMSAEEQVVDHLADRQALILLDNCEHLVEAAAALAAQILRECPRVTLLATSREPLRIAGERAWRVPSLPLPGPQTASGTDAATGVATLMRVDTVRLFVERASAASGFALTERNAGAVAQICRRLDGIPLAIELAAALTPALAPAQIAERLDDRFRLLTEGDRTVLPRHQTLLETVRWSYDLLTEPERHLFRRLGIFAGTWTLDAAEAVCEPGRRTPNDPTTQPPNDPTTQRPNDPTTQPPNDPVLPLLVRLVQKSLVIAEEREGAARYRMLETVRAYARDRMDESGEADHLAERHTAFYLSLAQAAEPELSGPDQGAWLDRLEEARANLRALLARGGDAALQAAAALWRFWLIRGHWSEGRRHLESALTLPLPFRRERGPGGEGAIATVLHALGSIAYVQGDHVVARERLTEAAAMRDALGDRKGLASTLNNLGALARHAGDRGEAKARFERSLAIRKEIGDRSGAADSLVWLASLEYDARDYDAACRNYVEALAIYSELGMLDRSCKALRLLGVIAQERGELQEAQRYFTESLALSREIGARRDESEALMGLGNVFRLAGDMASAASKLAESLALAEELGDRLRCADCHANLGAIAILAPEPDIATAGTLFQTALGLYQQCGAVAATAVALEGLAAAAALRGNAVHAARHLGAAAEVRERHATPVEQIDLPVLDLATVKSRAALGEEAFQSETARGRGMALDEVLQTI